MPETRLDVILKLNDKASKEILGIVRNIDKNNIQLTKSQTRLTKATNATSQAFRALGGVLITLGVAKVAKDTVRAAIDFEDAFAGVRKTVDATEKEFQQLNQGLITLSKNIPVAATELARIQELAGQLGVNGVDNLTKFTETISKISVTTNLTTESAATDFARIANIMQTPINEVDRMGAAVVDLGNNFATTEAEIVNFANRIAGAGKVVGLTEADIFAFGTAFSSVGVEAERGGTAVSKALIKIGDAVNVGGKDLENFAKISGLTAQEFARSFKEDAGKTFALFIEGLGKAGLEGAQILRELELSDQRLIQSFLSVGGASGILTRAIDRANIAYEENNALNIEAQKRFETTASKIQLIKNNVTSLQIEIGNKLLPVFERLLVLTKQYVDFTTGTDLNKNKVQILTEEYQKQVEKIENIKLQLSGVSGFLNIAFGHGENLTKELEVAQRQLALLADELNNLGRIPNFNEPIGTAPFGLSQEYFDNINQNLDNISNKAQPVKSVFDGLFDEPLLDQDKFFAGVSQGLAGVAVQVQSFSEFWNSLWRSMAFTIIKEVVQKALTQVIAKLTIIKTLSSGLGGLFGGIGGFFGRLFHEGGAVKAHSGMYVRAHNGLAVDEVPIIAQTGEGILNRRAMQSIGGEQGLNRLNRGQSTGGTIINISVNNPVVKEGMDIKKMADMLGTEIERQLRYARG